MLRCRWLMALALVLIAVGLVPGCGERRPPVADTTPFLTEEEWRKLPPEERHDPYILRRLQTQPRP